MNRNNYGVLYERSGDVYLLLLAEQVRDPGPAIGRPVITNCVEFLLSGLKAVAPPTMRDGVARMGLPDAMGNFRLEEPGA